MSLKIQVVFLFFLFSFFSFSVENVQINSISGITWCVFLSRANSTARCKRRFVAEFFQVYIVFLVVAIFARTGCYPLTSPLRDASHLYEVSIIDLSKMIRGLIPSILIILVTKPISITPVLSLARKASKKSSRSKRSLNSRSKPLVEHIFSYQLSYWGMSTLAVPVLLYIRDSALLAPSTSLTFANKRGFNRGLIRGMNGKGTCTTFLRVIEY